MLIISNNMFAYCNNNSPLFRDPNGTRIEYMGGGGGIGDKAFNAWLAESKKSDTSSSEKNVLEKVNESIGAVIYSVSLYAGAGTGFGGTINDGIFSLSGITKHDRVSIILDPKSNEPIRFGETWTTSGSLGFKAIPGATIGSGTTTFKAFGSDVLETIDTIKPECALTLGGYLGVGATLDFSWDIEYIGQRFEEIWW